jgi:hypothetical protein
MPNLTSSPPTTDFIDAIVLCPHGWWVRHKVGRQICDGSVVLSVTAEEAHVCSICGDAPWAHGSRYHGHEYADSVVRRYVSGWAAT